MKNGKNWKTFASQPPSFFLVGLSGPILAQKFPPTRLEVSDMFNLNPDIDDRNLKTLWFRFHVTPLKVKREPENIPLEKEKWYSEPSWLQVLCQSSVGLNFGGVRGINLQTAKEKKQWAKETNTQPKNLPVESQDDGHPETLIENMQESFNVHLSYRCNWCRCIYLIYRCHVQFTLHICISVYRYTFTKQISNYELLR